MPHFYSIGYATKAINTFLGQLRHHGISAVADVRSVPYSKAFHDYHREALRAALQAAGIRYVWLGEELGPRSKDSAHYDTRGQVQFDRLMASPLFLQGIDRLEQGRERRFRIALLCAEKDPAICHRSLLVGYYLTHSAGSSISHIRHDGSLESQEELEQRLCDLHGVGEDLFAGSVEQAERAWRLQCCQCAYVLPGGGGMVE